jgi:hypothetical protein
MRKLMYRLKQLCKRNRDGSFATQADREREVSLIADQLCALGYHLENELSLKAKHGAALAALWQSQSLSIGTMKNRMATLRWWAEKIGKPATVMASNAAYGIGQRSYVAKTNKAHPVDQDGLARVTDPAVALSLRLQEAFGLRRAESIKIRPAQANRGDRLALKASWTKGGRAREVPIRTAGQRQLLDQAKALAKTLGGSLIPAQLKYVDQLRIFKSQCAKAGIHHVHGHRHLYAQQRYLELTGRPAPAAGGRSAKLLSPEERIVDRNARLMISRELGHEREQITTVYLGR